MALMTCRDLSLGYDGDVLVRDLSFEVNAGDYLCIVGENGAGKSTLMRTLLGLQPPLSGSITFGEGLRRQDLGWLPQQTPVQRDFPAAVGEIVLSGCQAREGFHPFYTKADKARAQDAMARMDITALSGRCYRELSGGQQQRVLLCRALCAAHELLILDEPVTGLDPAASPDLYKTLRYLHERENVAIVMVTHDVDTALREAKTILHIGQKRWFYGTAAEYLRDESGRRFAKK